MITTLTPAINAAAHSPEQAILALIGVLVLLILVIQKDLAGEARTRAQQFRQALDIAVVPLLIAFSMIITLRVVEALLVRY